MNTNSITGTGEISRRSALRTLLQTSVAVGGSLCVTGQVMARSRVPALRAGDLVVTRNRFNNIVPGYWNHVAIYNGRGSFIEGQAGPGKVIRTRYSTFINRYRTLSVYRYDNSRDASRAARMAERLIGREYDLLRKYGSGSYTCITLVRAAYHTVTNRDPRWWLPSHVPTTSGFRYVRR